jgi:hypothetical protein
MMKAVVRRVCIVFVALAVMTTVASAVVRVNYNYAATGIGEGSGLWSVTIDSGLIPTGDPNAPYLEPNKSITFMAPMAAPVFTQRDVLLEGDMIPSVEEMPGLVGWANDATGRGNGIGMEWVFYGPNDTVTLRSVTEDYTNYTWEVQTILANVGGDDEVADLTNQYRWAVSFADNPAGLDAGNGTQWRPVSFWGDVSNGAGHRHSGNKFETSRGNPIDVGQDIGIDGTEGYLGADADGDGIGVSLGFRRADGSEALSTTGSMFFYDVIFGGDVFADPNTITKAIGKLGD